MKILYITTPREDYLQDQILIGLKELYGADVIDYPKKDVLYSNCLKPKQELYGRGFTIWKNLPDIEIDRKDTFPRIQSGEFDIVIFGSIWRQTEIFAEFRSKNMFRTDRLKICFLDGEDRLKIYKPALLHGTYFKREQARIFRLPFFIKEINFSIPDCKLRRQAVQKNKLFAMHVQCEEAYKIPEIREHCQKKYAFSDEGLYYDDIARSEYAVTMKKEGWDCMRHYEIAANKTVPCFYNLSKKPKHCAPHGLVDMENVVAFNTADELREKIDHIKKAGVYTKLQNNAFQWAESNTCSKIARMVLNQL